MIDGERRELERLTAIMDENGKAATAYKNMARAMYRLSEHLTHLVTTTQLTGVPGFLYEDVVLDNMLKTIAKHGLELGDILWPNASIARW